MNAQSVRPCCERSFVRAKLQERMEARKLRHNGYTVRHIALLLRVSVSSVSVWVQDIAAPEPDAVPEPTPEPEPVGSKWCPRCSAELPLARFNRYRGGHQGWCRECFRAYFKKRGDLHRTQSNQARVKRRNAAKQLVADHRTGNPCIDCGETDPDVLEFDHIGAKRGDVSALTRQGTAARTLIKELEACEVVCVNCHRRRTAQQIGSWRLNPAEIDRSTRLLPGERRNLHLLAEILETSSCADCAESDLIVLDFDHLGGKSSEVPKLARSGCGIARLRHEIARCEVRCANCHRRRTLRVLRERLAA